METSVNNKCRAFTSLEQSKVLAKILPLESADMYYERTKEESEYKVYVGKNLAITYNLFSYRNGYTIPCWSLAALLSVLPRIDIEKEICSDDTFDYRVKAYIGDGYIGDWFDNPIDACYEMVIRLHELKML